VTEKGFSGNRREENHSDTDYTDVHENARIFQVLSVRFREIRGIRVLITENPKDPEKAGFTDRRV